MDLRRQLRKSPNGIPRLARKHSRDGHHRSANPFTGKEIGSTLQAGQKGHMIESIFNDPMPFPMYDVYSQLSYALKASDVERSSL